MADWLVILNDKIIKQFSLNEGEKVTIGRGREADITIDNTAISRLHIAIESTAGIYLVSDLGSKNGTFVNGEKIQANEPISDSALIEFGKFRLTPASGTDEAMNIADSVSANIMDLDEETVFVTGGQEGLRSDNNFSQHGEKARLTLISGSGSPKNLQLEGKNSIKIGKEASCDLVVPGFFVAKAQCYIFKRENDFFLVPQKSWVGTFVNDLKITDERKLAQGDIIRIRQTSIRFNH